MTEPSVPDLEHLFSEHRLAILRYAERRTGDVNAAYDVLADVFEVACRERGRWPRDRALPWLYGVAANVLAHRRRSEARAAAAYQRAGNDLATRPGPDSPAEQVERAAEVSGVLAALSELSADDQEVLLLFAWEGLHGKDLAVALGVSTSGARMRLKRARARLGDVQRRHGDALSRSAGSTVLPATRSRTQGEHS